MINSGKFVNLCLIIAISSLSAYAQKDSSLIKQLSRDADIILYGKVTDKISSWNESKTRIYTKTTVQVGDVLKGQGNENTIEIISPGGEVDGVGEIYTHMPRFSDKEEVLVFLKKDYGNNSYKVLNGEQGKITVYEDEKSKEKITGSNLRIEDLKSQIQSYLEEQ